MASVNKVFLMGNLTRDPELRYTPSGTAVCEFGLAVNRTYMARDGQQRDETCFVDVTMWGQRGVVISEYFTKGRPIFIEGRLKYDSWETNEGRRTKLSVVAEDFQFVGPPPGKGGESPSGGRSSAAPAGRRQAPPARGGTPSGRQQGPDEPEPEEGMDVSEDEIPF